jgi:predicted nucleic acid-binding protein
LVVDASVAVEYLPRTALGRRAADVLEGAELWAPELLDVEVLSLLRRAVAAKRLDPRRAHEAVGDLAAWGPMRVGHRGLIADAWALRNNVTACDAFYVAVARHHQADLITCDGPLARAPRLGVVVHNLTV